MFLPLTSPHYPGSCLSANHTTPAPTSQLITPPSSCLSAHHTTQLLPPSSPPPPPQAIHIHHTLSSLTTNCTLPWSMLQVYLAPATAVLVNNWPRPQRLRDWQITEGEWRPPKVDNGFLKKKEKNIFFLRNVLWGGVLESMALIPCVFF